MFPPSNLQRGLRFQGHDVEDRFFQQLRVCSHQAFDRYFQFATPVGDVSQADIDSIASMADEAALEDIFSRLAKHDLIDVMLTRIASLQEMLPLKDAATFLAALYQIPVPNRWYSFFDSSPRDRVRSITYWYLRRLPEAERLTVMQDALSMTRGVALAIPTVQLLTHGSDPGSSGVRFSRSKRIATL
jgi:hypothetical protein